MAVYTRNRLDSLTSKIHNKQISPIYLIFGDRFLCQQAAEKICTALSVAGGTIHSINGEREDITTSINRFRSYSLLPGRQIYKIIDTKIFHSKKIGSVLWQKAQKAYKDNKQEKAAGYIHSLLDISSIQPGDFENDLCSISKTRWQKLFGFAMPDSDISWANNLLEQFIRDNNSRLNSKNSDPAVLLEKTLTTGIPADNTLILISEVVDKRKRFYKFLKDNYVVVDLAVDTGSSSGAKRAQRSILIDLVHDTLARFNKTITNDVAERLIERIGFQPVAIVLETEKLACYTEPRTAIVKQDLDAIVGRSRQEALFELTGAIGNRDLAKTLLIASRLQENGIHGLAIIATLRNFTRNLLLFRALQEQPRYGYSHTMPPAIFQSRVLPKLKETGRWEKEISIHPYALYRQFKTAHLFPLTTLRRWLVQILETELKLKGSPLTDKLVIEHLLISILLNSNKAGLLKKQQGIKL